MSIEFSQCLFSCARHCSNLYIAHLCVCVSVHDFEEEGTGLEGGWSRQKATVQSKLSHWALRSQNWLCREKLQSSFAVGQNHCTFCRERHSVTRLSPLCWDMLLIMQLSLLPSSLFRSHSWHIKKEDIFNLSKQGRRYPFHQQSSSACLSLLVSTYFALCGFSSCLKCSKCTL